MKGIVIVEPALSKVVNVNVKVNGKLGFIFITHFDQLSRRYNY